MSDRTYPTKVDTWITVVLSLSAIVTLVSVTLAAVVTRNAWVAISSLIPVFVVALLIWPMNYTLRSEDILIKSGIIKMRVPYKDIESIQPTRSALSAPAMSLDRLKIKMKKGSVMVSPEDRSGFLRELEQRSKVRM